MEQPLVTCIMPTANRKEFVSAAIDNFLKQDYPNAELVIIDDGIESCIDIIPDKPNIRYFYSKPLGTIGIKRNVACEKANGKFIIHWDDDDWYAPDWISQQTEALLASKADITGLGEVIFYSLTQSFGYAGTDENGRWLCGATIAYKKKLWSQYPFSNLQIGEDTDFLLNSGGKIFVLNYLNGFKALIHDKNTSIRFLENMNTITWEVLNS